MKKTFQTRLLVASLLVALTCAVPRFDVATLFASTFQTPADSIEQVIKAELHPQDYRGPRTLSTDTLWHPDILSGYEARSVNLPVAWDGPVVATIVRRKAPRPTTRGVLYVHGFNDYFFQSEMGEWYNSLGMDFYAVDLRRYGRSLRPWQYPFDVRDMKEYFQDIDAALAQMTRDGLSDITLAGHSTGGLTTALYVAERGARCGVKRLVTDSPFLEWNFPAFYRKFLIPCVSAWGKVSPSTSIKQSHCDAYAASLLKSMHGGWTYNTAWKMTYSPPVKAGWIRAITRGQKALMKKAGNITVPVLVMHSSRGMHACSWDSACMTADLVLDPKMIAKRGARLGRNPQVATIDSGIHDLILSPLPARTAAYDSIRNFIFPGKE